MERSVIRVGQDRRDPAFPPNSGVSEFGHLQFCRSRKHPTSAIRVFPNSAIVKFAQIGNIRLAPLMRATLAMSFDADGVQRQFIGTIRTWLNPRGDALREKTQTLCVVF